MFANQIPLNVTTPPAPEREKRERWHTRPKTIERRYTTVRPEPEVPEFLRNPTKEGIFVPDDHPTSHTDNETGVYTHTPKHTHTVSKMQKKMIIFFIPGLGRLQITGPILFKWFKLVKLHSLNMPPPEIYKHSYT